MSFKTWKEIDWSLTEKTISRLQQRIFKASLERNRQKLRKLQRRLILSEEARWLSVRRVTELNRRKKTHCVDKMAIMTSKAKLAMAKKLKLDGSALPIRRVRMTKPEKTERHPLTISTINDRAKQMLLKLALEPEWEAKFEANSYGFRPGRNSHDAIRAIYLKLRGTHGYILDANIRKYFDMIDHDKLLVKLCLPPFMGNQIKAWLEAGIMHTYKNQSKATIETTTMGTPQGSIVTQGGIISPLLANIALHGLETSAKDFYVEHVYNGPKKTAKRDHRRKLSVIRYADDFVIIANEECEILKVKAYISEWLINECGLELSEEKTSIIHSAEGFDFLGFHLISLKPDEKYICRIHISKTSKKKFLTKTRLIFQKYRSASAGNIIAMLNPVITGWCNYFKYCDCVRDFKQVEYAFFGQLRAWVFRRSSKGLKSRQSIKKKYCPSETMVAFNGIKHKGNWILIGQILMRNGKQKKVNLVYPSWIRSSRHIKIRDIKSPFDGDHIYWSKRAQQYGAFNTTEKKLLVVQKGRCNMCNKLFLPGNTIEKDPIQRVAGGGRNVISNFQLLHRHCHEVKSRKEQQGKSKNVNIITREPDEGKPSRPDLKSSVDSKEST